MQALPTYSPAMEKWKGFDSDTVGKRQGDVIVPDHPASAKMNKDKALQALATMQFAFAGPFLDESALTCRPVGVVGRVVNTLFCLSLLGYGPVVAARDALQGAVHGARALLD